jgi:dTDP-4-dehydrorhamnose 3,5-epimerase
MNMLAGIKVKQLKRFSDERGFFTELMRKDWKDLLNTDSIVQSNLSITYPGMVRAWHRHQRGQVDYFVVLKGALKLCAYDEETSELDEIISTGSDFQIVRIVGSYWHGFKVAGNEPAWLLYFVNKLYEQENPDEERRPWNDPTIIPRSINGKTNDPRIGKPWDWNYPPHK